MYLPDEAQGPEQDVTGDAVDAVLRKREPVVSDQQAQFNRAQWVASKQEPSRWGKVLKIAKEKNVSPQFVDRNFDELTKDDVSKAVPYGSLADTPRTRDWLSNPDNAIVSRDHIEDIKTLEKRLAYLHDPTQRAQPESVIRPRAIAAVDATLDREWEGYKQLERESEDPSLGLPNIKARTPEQEIRDKAEFRHAQIEGRIEAAMKREAFIGSEAPAGVAERIEQRLTENPAAMIPYVGGVLDAANAIQIYKDAKAIEAGSNDPEILYRMSEMERMARATERRGTTWFSDVAALVAQSSVFAAEFAGTGGLYNAGKIATLGGAKALAGGILRGAMQKALAKSVGWAVGSTAQAAVAEAPFFARRMAERMTPQGTLEMNGDQIRYKVLPGTGEAPLSSAWHAAVESWSEMASERTGKLLEFADKPIGSLLKKAFLAKHPSATAEAFAHALHKGGVHGILGEMAEEEIGKLMNAVGGATDGYTLPTWREVGVEFAGFSAPQLGHAALHHVGSRLSNPEGFKKVGESGAALAPMAEISPESANALAETISPDAHVYQTGPSFTTYWQKQGMNPAMVAESLGAKESYAHALAVGEGGTVAIPLREYVRQIAPSEHNAALAQELKTDPFEASPTEEKELAARAQGMTVGQVEEAKKQASFEESVGNVIKTAQKRLEDAGFSESAAKLQALVEGAQAKVRAKILGITPEEVATRRGLTMEREGLTPMTVAGEGALEQPSRETPSEGMAALQASLTERGVQLEANVDEKGKRLSLSKVVVDEALRGEGVGTSAMTDIVNYADRHGLSISLSPSTDFGATSIGRLKDFYKRFGFVENKGKHKDFSTKDSMIREPKVYEQPSGSEIPRGRILLGLNADVIQFLKKANRTTYFHEMSHRWLDEFRRDFEELSKQKEAAASKSLDLISPQGLTVEQERFLDDGRKILDYLGVKSWDEIERPHHERWAEANEKYYMEGKAPSSALRAAFGRFRDWFLEVYRKITGSGVQLTDEVRGVIDRMLATEDEIKAVEEENKMSPMFADALASGMSVPDAIAYANQQTLAHEAGFDTLVKKNMEGLRRKNQRWFKEEREQTRKEVEQAVNNLPVYQAIAAIKKGETPDGRPLEAKLTLDREMVHSLYGEEILKALPRGIVGDTGMAPDAVAGMFGYSDGAALLNEIIGASAKDVKPGAKEAEIRAKLAELAQARENLLSTQEPLSSEQKTAIQTAKSGREKIQRKLERDMKVAERDSLRDIKDALRDIKDRGGITPSTANADLSEAFHGTGVKSDELAQEFADRGLIKTASSEELYDWIKKAEQQVKASKKREKEIPKEAKRLAGERLDESLQALINNAAVQEQLRQELADVGDAEAEAKRSGMVEGRVALIERETNDQMRAKYADVAADPAAIYEAAEKAAHNADRSEMMYMEAKHLSAMAVKNAVRRAGMAVRSTAAVRDQAEQMIGKLKVRDVNPLIHQRAEQEAARLAHEAINKKDLSEALWQQERRRLSHELYRAAVEARDGVEEDIKDFRRLNGKDEDIAKARNIDHVNVARALTSGFKLGTVGSQIAASDHMKQIAEYDQDGYKRLMEDFIAPMEASYKDYRELTVEEWRELRRAVDALWDRAAADKEIEIEGKRESRELIQGKLAARFREIDGVKAKKEEYQRTASKFDKFVGALFGARASARRMESWADAVDVDKERRGITTQTYVNPVQRAAAAFAEARKSTFKEYLDLISKLDLKETYTQREIKAHEIGFAFRNKSELLKALLNIGNASNLQKMLRGWGWGALDQDGKLDRSRWDAFIKRAEAEGTITAKDYAWVQGVWDLFDRLKMDAQKAHKAMYGYHFSEITAEPVVTKYGTFRGGYVPMDYDKFESQDAAKRAAKETLLNGDNGFSYPAVGRGFTKARNEQYTAKVSLDLKSLSGALDAELRMIHLGPVVKDLARLTLDRNFSRDLAQFDRTISDNLIVPYLKRTATQRTEAVSGTGEGWRFVDSGARMLRKNTGINIMAGNIVNALQNLTGLRIAAALVPGSKIRRQMWNYLHQSKRMADEMERLSPYMRNRETTPLAEMRKEVDDMIDHPSTYENFETAIQKNAYFTTKATQNAVDKIVWWAAYEHAQETITDGTQQEQTEFADSVVRRTQDARAPQDISRVEAGGPVAQVLLMYYSYWNMRANLNVTEFTKLARDGGFKSNSGRAFYLWAVMVAIPAIVGAGIVKLARGAGLDDDDDGYMDDVVDLFLGSQVRELAAQVPVGGQVINSVLNRFNKNPMDDRISVSPAFTAIEASASVPFDVYHSIKEQEITRKTVKDVLTLAGIVSGLPLAPVAKPVGYAMDVKKGTAKPTGPVDYMRGLVTGASGQKH